MDLMKLAIPSDKLMWDIWMSRYQLSVVTIADEIGLFNYLKSSSLSLAKLAEVLAIGERAVEVLAEILIGLGFIKKIGKKVALNQISKTYFLSDSPFYWGVQLKGLRERIEHKQILEAITKNTHQLFHNGKQITAMWEEGTITEEAARNFTQQMHATILAPALHAIKSGLFKATRNLLDVGGGSGCFCAAYVKLYPKSTATVFELPTVGEVTKQYLEKLGVTKKVSIYSGNFFNDPWPTGHDGVLFSQIFHDWPRLICEKLARNAFNILPKGGRIYIYEMLLNDNRTAPLTTACFDLLMLINHRSQQFTKAEVFDLLRTVGFKKIKTKQIFGYYSLVIAEK